MTTIKEIASVLSFCVEVPRKKVCEVVEWTPPLSRLLDTICDIKDCALGSFNETLTAQCHLVCEKVKLQEISKIAKTVYVGFSKRADSQKAFPLMNTADLVIQNKGYVEALKVLAKQIVEFPISNKFSKFLSNGEGVKGRGAVFLSLSIPKPIIKEVVNFALVEEVVEQNVNSIEESVLVTMEPFWKTAHTVGLVTLVVLGVATGALALTCYRNFFESKEKKLLN